MILAGAGAGKTRTLIHRIAWLLAWCLERMWEILLVTFGVRAEDLVGRRARIVVCVAEAVDRQQRRPGHDVVGLAGLRREQARWVVIAGLGNISPGTSHARL
jgi:superfamily I DNA/RNA helicase